MISHRHKCIFIHIPKCAGTSIERALGHYDGQVREPDHRSMRMMEPVGSHRLMLGADNRFQLALRLRERYFSKRRNPNNCLVVNADQYSSYFKFAVVRNPWSRAYSWYENCLRHTPMFDRLGLSKDISFPDFLRSQAGRRALRPQTSWLIDHRGKISLDFIARFENLHNDYLTICDRLGLKDVELPHERPGGLKSYQLNYDNASIDLVANVYREEIELFRYSFDD